MNEKANLGVPGGNTSSAVDNVSDAITDRQSGSVSAGAIAPVRYGTDETLEMTDLFGASAVPIAAVNNFDGTPINRWDLELLSTGADCLKGSEMIGEKIRIKYYYLHRVELADQHTGEIISTIRTVLISPDRIAVAFISEGIAKSLYSTITHLGKGPYDPPLEVSVRQISTGSGRRYYLLERVIEL